MEPLPQTLVVARWRHGEHGTVETRRVYGLDYDGCVGTGRDWGDCTDALDYASAWRGERGVDDAYFTNLLALAEPAEGIDCAVTADATGGQGLVGLAVDASAQGVFVSLLELRALDTPLAVEGCALAPGARVEASLVERAPAELRRDGDRTIVEASFAELWLPLGPANGRHPIEDVRIELEVDASGRIERAELGAAVTHDTIHDVFVERGLGGISMATVRDLAGADLDPDETGACQRVSIGLGLELAPVEVAER